MELEAWLLGMFGNLERIDPLLSPENIRNGLGFDLQVIDPETTFFHPAVQFEQVLRLANRAYGKHGDEMESIVSGITLDDMRDVVAAGRCRSFTSFLSEIQREFDESQN